MPGLMGRSRRVSTSTSVNGRRTTGTWRTHPGKQALLQVKAFNELTPDQKERALAMFAPLRPHTEYLYELDLNGDVRCRRYIKAHKMAGPVQG